MSIPSLATVEPTISSAELHAAAASTGIKISAADEKTYLAFASAFDASCTNLLSLPPYSDPRLSPIPTTQPRAFLTPPPAHNPLNAWSQKCLLTATHPESTALKGKTVALKANISVAGADLNIGTHPHFFPGGRFHVPDIDATVVRRILLAGGTVVGTGTCENFSLSGVSVTAETGPVRNAWDPTRATGGSSSGVGSLLSIKDVRQARRSKELRSNGTGDTFGGEKENADSLGEFEEGVDMAVGGDQGGSIRLPAHFSGVYGLKPTYGLVPYTGIASLYSGIDHAGPMARSVEDVALLLGVLAGADGIDFRQNPWTPLKERVPKYQSLLKQYKEEKAVQGEWTADSAGKGLRIGVLKEGWEAAGLDQEVAEATQAAVRRYKDIGAEVIDISVPMHKLAPTLWSIGCRHALLDCLTNQPSAMLGHPMPGFEPLASHASHPSHTTSNESNEAKGEDANLIQQLFDYISPINPAISNALLNAPLLRQKYGPEISRKAQMHIHELTAAFDEAFANDMLDVIVLPVSGKPAPLIPDGVTTEHVSPSGVGNGATSDPYKLSTSIKTTLDPLQAAQSFVGVTLNTAGFNLTGHPAMSFPCAWVTPADGKADGLKLTHGKLPIGLQVVGRKNDDISVLRAVQAWEVRGRIVDEMARAKTS